ncbi:unnamed protein product [Rotaria socialis]
MLQYQDTLSITISTDKHNNYSSYFASRLLPSSHWLLIKKVQAVIYIRHRRFHCNSALTTSRHVNDKIHCGCFTPYLLSCNHSMSK